MGDVFEKMDLMMSRMEFDPPPADATWSPWVREQLFFVERMQVADCAPPEVKDMLRREGWKPDDGRSYPP